MCVARLPSGGLWVHAPVRLDAPTREALERLGPVVAIVAPNTFHYFFLEEYARAYPTAALFSAPGLAERCAGLPSGERLGDEAPALWAGVLDQRVFGPIRAVSEVIFLHRSSGTLILTDLAKSHPRPPWEGLPLREALATRLFYAWFPNDSVGST